jgi:hypothetical protein
LFARELAEAGARVVVRADRLAVRIARVGGDLLRHRPELRDDRCPVPLLAEERLDPGLRAVVGRHVGVDEQLAEEDADADLGEGPEREDPLRARDERVDLGVLALQLRDDRADRLVDQRDPDVFGHDS